MERTDHILLDQLQDIITDRTAQLPLAIASPPASFSIPPCIKHELKLSKIASASSEVPETNI